MAKLALKWRDPAQVLASSPVNYRVEFVNQPGADNTHVANINPCYDISEGGITDPVTVVLAPPFRGARYPLCLCTY